MSKCKKTTLYRQEASIPTASDQTPISEIDKKRKKKVRIIGEVKEKREKNIKHFLKEDLTFEAAIYNEDVHYYSDGEWKDIDNSIIEGKDDENNDVLENKNSDIKIKVAKKVKSKKLVTIQKGKYQISWGIDKAANSDAKIKDKPQDIYRNYKNSKNKHIKEKDKKRQVISEDVKTEDQLIEAENIKKQTLKNISSTIEFSNVYPNIDLEYTINSNKLKESIIIKEKVNNPVFAFNINVKNLVAVIQEDHSIIFYDDKDTSIAIFKIDPPFMSDANGVVSKNIIVNLVKDNKDYNITWTPNNDWLKDSKYPVIIDPTIGTPQEKSAIFDSFITESSPYQNFGGLNYLRIGKEANLNRIYSFIKFTLPVDKLTSADFIIGARLVLSPYQGGNYTNLQINAHRVLQDWSSSTITWNQQPAYNEAKVEDYANLPPPSGNEFYFDITSLVKSWFLSGGNYGILLKSDNISTGYADFASSDTSEDIMGYRPVILIDYVNNSGLKNYWTYHSQDVERAGTGYINDFNGNLVFVHNDISMSGSKMPLTLNHVFNSSEKDQNAFGNQENSVSNYGLGWRLNLSQRVESVLVGTNQYYVYTDEDGTKHYFYYDDKTSSYKQELSTDLTFNKNSDGTFSIKDKSGTVLDFTNTGYLYRIKDKNDNTMTLSYEGAILKKITDGAGRVTTLNVLSNGYLVGITEPSGRQTKFEYDGIELKKITYSDKNYSEFAYDSITNNLIEAGNYDQNKKLIYKVKYTYTTQKPYRVIKTEEFGLQDFKETAGGSLDIRYENNVSTFTYNKEKGTNKEAVYTYEFNSYGNTICVRDSEGGAQYYKFMRDTKLDKRALANKLASESKLQRFKTNYLRDYSVEKWECSSN